MTEKSLAECEGMEVVVFTVKKARWLACLLLVAGAASVFISIAIAYVVYSVLIAI